MHSHIVCLCSLLGGLSLILNHKKGYDLQTDLGLGFCAETKEDFRLVLRFAR